MRYFIILMFYYPPVFDSIIFHWAQKFPVESVSQGYCSPEPEPKISDPQHCLSESSCTNDAFFLCHHTVDPNTLHIIAQEIKTDKVIESAPVMRNLKSDITR
jgi:hypothetical protein